MLILFLYGGKKGTGFYYIKIFVMFGTFYWTLDLNKIMKYNEIM